ncbi:hypothetical protein ACTWP5_01405 [Streptomyces sp. 4N509B]|uniref:hypothetical protein n=1 Tax=Streptomyces sp. 4N509B TaxID=3457413 RepID=UPI003FD40863
MITTTPIARWTWHREGPSSDPVSDCLGAVLAARQALLERALITSAPSLFVSVWKQGTAQTRLFKDRLPVPSGDHASASQRLAGVIENHASQGSVGLVDANIECAGDWLGPEGAVHEPRMFVLGCIVMIDALVLQLETVSDAWMSHDLRGNRQPEIFELNQPRLAMALRTLSTVMDTETVPGDPTDFGIPNDTGVAPHARSDGTVPDTWRIFELPLRERRP